MITNLKLLSLVKAKKLIEDKLWKQAKRYNKTYPSKILYIDTKHPSGSFHL
ncbi:MULTISPECIES: hypothetical protein [unclassified Gilliamella]|uniref:hypothetical protein n=1 Tax=unclassified Gilliamella TaxID=2685620 RepID=UPI0013210E0B|nr:MULTISPECIES: hypothetical protein [unclassified Gilliamella]MWN32044.1 hypothetical protein [Gilliamella sp. Pra-s60]